MATILRPALLHLPHRHHSPAPDPIAQDLARRRRLFLRRRRLARLRATAATAGWLAGTALLAVLTLGGLAGLIGLR